MNDQVCATQRKKAPNLGAVSLRLKGRWRYIGSSDARHREGKT